MTSVNGLILPINTKKILKEKLQSVANMNSLKILFCLVGLGEMMGITMGLILPKPLLAQPTQVNCQSPETQRDMNICASRDAEVADRRLNQVYKQLQAKVSDSQSKKELIDAETAWIKFRDRDCRFAAGLNRGGSIASMIQSQCVANLTRQRTKQLEDYLKNLD